ncbi:Na(+)-translocating NADH-quinone reductase subunit B [compost metagenome]
MLGALFIATDPVSSPVGRNGRLLFGAGCGALVYVIRTWGSFPEAVAFAVLFMNALAPLIDRYCRPRAYGRNGRGKPLAIGRQTSSVKQEG